MLMVTRFVSACGHQSDWVYALFAEGFRFRIRRCCPVLRSLWIGIGRTFMLASLAVT